MSVVFTHGPYFLCLAIISIAFWGIIANQNYFKKLLCLNLLQVGTILFFIALGKINNNKVPSLRCFDLKECGDIVDPLPQVLMLTAIVVGVATMSVGLAIIIRIKKSFKTVEEHKLMEFMQE